MNSRPNEDRREVASRTLTGLRWHCAATSALTRIKGYRVAAAR